MHRCDNDSSSADDAGFTLVELMAALTILAVGVVGAVGVMGSSMRVAGTTGARSKGVAVATQQLETLRAIPYDQLVPAASGDSFTTVERRIENRVYTVKWVVTLENEVTPGQTGTLSTGAYKKAFVWVSWTDEAGVHDVHQTTLIYPGGRGKHGTSAPAASSANTGPPEPPVSLSATPLVDSTKVDLAWVPPPPSPTAPPPSSWVVQYSTDPTFPEGAVHQVPDAPPAAVTELRISDLAAETTYHFRVFSALANGVRGTGGHQVQRDHGRITAGRLLGANSLGDALWHDQEERQGRLRALHEPAGRSQHARLVRHSRLPDGVLLG